MSTYIFDQEGFVDEVGNSATMEAFSKALKPLGKAFVELFDKGVTEDLDGLDNGFRAMDLKKFEPDMQEALKEFKRTVRRASGVVILSDGCGFMPPGMTEEDYT